MNQDSVTLTMRELRALRDQQVNLTSAYPRYQLTTSQRAIVEDLSRIFRQAEESPYEDLSNKFKESFYSIGHQQTAILLNRATMLCYSASLCAQIVATYLRVKDLKVALIEPTFDNVPRILKTEGVKLFALSEYELIHLEEYILRTGVNAVWIVQPNNPTGTVLCESDFVKLLDVCVRHSLLLVVDFCFRLFSEEMMWDQYRLLESSGVTYVAIEDTGKTWPTQEMKVGLLQTSADIYDGLYHLYDNHLLQVSPVVLGLLSEMIEDTRKQGTIQTILKSTISARDIVLKTLHGSILGYDPPKATVPFAWLHIDSESIDDVRICDILRDAGIHLLPGSNFYWHNPHLGRKYIRVALAREAWYIEAGMYQLREVLRGFSTTS